jgi:hypothetical protein
MHWLKVSEDDGFRLNDLDKDTRVGEVRAIRRIHDENVGRRRAAGRTHRMYCEKPLGPPHCASRIGIVHAATFLPEVLSRSELSRFRDLPFAHEFVPRRCNLRASVSVVFRLLVRSGFSAFNMRRYLSSRSKLPVQKCCTAPPSRPPSGEMPAENGTVAAARPARAP